MARSRRLSTSAPIRDGPAHYAPIDEEEPPSDIPDTDDEHEVEDFEETPRPPDALPMLLQQRALTESVAHFENKHKGGAFGGLSRMMPSRTGSMATVRLQRRAGLAAKLKEVFELDAIEEVWAGE